MLGARTLLANLAFMKASPLHQPFPSRVAPPHFPSSSPTPKDSSVVHKSIAIRRPLDELYFIWRDFENLPRIMKHLESVTTSQGRRSHWIAKSVGGIALEWDAEIVDELPGELISWRSLDGSDVENEGSVQFRELSGDKGVEITVSLRYSPPGGKLSIAFAKLFGRDAAAEIEEDLARFKQFMEAGEVASVDGQSSARDKDRQPLRREQLKPWKSFS